MTIEKSPSTVFTALADATGVLLNVETLFYYSLNRTGAALWQQIEARRAVTIEELVRETCERFDVDEKQALRDVTAFVERLKQFKMVRTG